MLKLLVFSALVALVSGCVNPPCRCKPFPCDDYDNLKISHRSSDRCAPQDYVCQARVRMENGGNIKNYRSTDSYCAPQDYICQAKRRDRLLALMDPRQNPDGPGRTQQPVPHPSGRPSGPVRTVPGPSEPEPQPDPDGRETLPGPSKPQPLPGPNEREPQPVPDVPKDPKEMKVYFDKKLQEAATVLEYFPEKKPEFRLKFLTVSSFFIVTAGKVCTLFKYYFLIILGLRILFILSNYFFFRTV